MDFTFWKRKGRLSSQRRLGQRSKPGTSCGSALSVRRPAMQEVRTGSAICSIRTSTVTPRFRLVALMLAFKSPVGSGRTDLKAVFPERGRGAATPPDPFSSIRSPPRFLSSLAGSERASPAEAVAAPAAAVPPRAPPYETRQIRFSRMFRNVRGDALLTLLGRRCGGCLEP